MSDNIYPIEQNLHKYCIAMSSSNEYVPYLCVYLLSIKKFASYSNIYDIVILESDITEENKNIIYNLICTDNIFVRFCNVYDEFNNIKLHIQYDYFAKQCYYRLLSGKIFNEYKRVIFTDIDLITNFDIYQLFEINMKNNAIAACEEFLWSKDMFRREEILPKTTVAQYIQNTVKVDKYFNTGVMLIDIEKFNEVSTFEGLINVATTNKFINQEQCVLNQVYKDKIFQLAPSYNYEIYNRIFNGTDETLKEYTKNMSIAKIFHWPTKYKVWFDPALPKGIEWWNYLKQTPYYEIVLKRMVDKVIENNSKGITRYVDKQVKYVTDKLSTPSTEDNILKNEIINVLNYKENLSKYRKYKFLKNFVWGKMKERYNKKKQLYKNKIQIAEAFFNSNL